VKEKNYTFMERRRHREEKEPKEEGERETSGGKREKGDQQ